MHVTYSVVGLLHKRTGSNVFGCNKQELSNNYIQSDKLQGWEPFGGILLSNIESFN